MGHIEQSAAESRDMVTINGLVSNSGTMKDKANFTCPQTPKQKSDTESEGPDKDERLVFRQLSLIPPAMSVLCALAERENRLEIRTHSPDNTIKSLTQRQIVC